MDATRSSADAAPANNMTNALIFQATLAGIIMLLSFIYNGSMMRSEANAWEQNTQNTQKKPAEIENSNKAQDLSTNSYPLSAVFRTTLTDPELLLSTLEQDQPVIMINGSIKSTKMV